MWVLTSCGLAVWSTFVLRSRSIGWWIVTFLLLLSLILRRRCYCILLSIFKHSRSWLTNGWKVDGPWWLCLSIVDGGRCRIIVSTWRLLRLWYFYLWLLIRTRSVRSACWRIDDLTWNLSSRIWVIILSGFQPGKHLVNHCSKFINIHVLDWLAQLWVDGGCLGKYLPDESTSPFPDISTGDVPMV